MYEFVCLFIFTEIPSWSFGLSLLIQRSWAGCCREGMCLVTLLAETSSCNWWCLKDVLKFSFNTGYFSSDLLASSFSFDATDRSTLGVLRYSKGT
jgi:hypothetical protein